MSLVVKSLSGAGGYKPGDLVVNMSVAIGAREWSEFTDVIGAADFWRLPTTERRIGRDGTRTIVEAVKHGRYHVVDRWQDHRFGHAFLYALELTGL